MPLTRYFTGPDEAISAIASDIEGIAAAFSKQNSYAFVEHRRLAADTHSRGDIYLELADVNQARRRGRRSARRQELRFPVSTPPIKQLRSEVSAVLGRWHISAVEETDIIRFGLLQCSDLPPQVFARAVKFAEGVFSGVDLALQSYLSDLTFFRYESTAAGEDWSNGSWAVDLSWKIIGSYSLLPTHNP
jgi:hypothetical protein